MDLMAFLVMFAVVLAIICITGTAAVGYFCVKLWIEMDSFKKSTHQIQYIDPMAALNKTQNGEDKPDDDPFDIIQ